MDDLLPPPVETILIYAAYGWAALNGYAAASGRPRLPERRIWVPLLHRLSLSPDGIAEIHDLARKGLECWGVAPSIRACLGDAFANERFETLLSEAIRHLADTAEPPLRLRPVSDFIPSKAPGADVPQHPRPSPSIRARPIRRGIRPPQP